MLKLKIKALLKEKGISGTTFAKNIGLHRNAAQALIQERVRGIRFDTLEKICRTYQVSIQDIVEYVPDATAHKKPSLKKYKQEGEVVPLTGMLPMETVSTLLWQKDGILQTGVTCDMYCKKTYGEIYLDRESFYLVADYAYRRLGDSIPTFIKEYTTYQNFADQIHTLYQKHSAYWSSYTPTEAIHLLSQLRSLYRGFWEASLFIDSFDTGKDMEQIEHIAHIHCITREDTDALLTPIEPTFADEKKLAFLKLVRESATKKYTISEEAVQAFIAQFDYATANYALVPRMNSKTIIEDIKKQWADMALVRAEIKRLSGYSNFREQTVHVILKKYRLTQNPFWFFARLTAWREHRKKINLMGMTLLDGVLTTLERMHGIPKKYLLYLSMDELPLVIHGTLSLETLKERYEHGVLIHIDANTQGPTFYTGIQAASLHEDIKNAQQETSDAPIEIITGKTASQGYARGKARIILTTAEFDTFQDGEILITSMTRPEFVPLMQRASAIITNEGGITCHAAIVSRELGKPCIIGTKNATQLIKNGDTIEVRANHGSIRIVQHAN